MARPDTAAHAVDARRDPLQGGVDLLDLGPGLGAEGQVALTLDRQRVALARLLVELDVAGLAVLGERDGLGHERIGLLVVVGPLRQQRLTLLVEELLVERRLHRLLRRGRLGRRSLLRGRGLRRRGLSWQGSSWPALPSVRRRLLGGRLRRSRPSWRAPSSRAPSSAGGLHGRCLLLRLLAAAELVADFLAVDDFLAGAFAGAFLVAIRLSPHAGVGNKRRSIATPLTGGPTSRSRPRCAAEAAERT